jgi:ribosomal protein S18 acetylase RimI-like enzyme
MDIKMVHATLRHACDYIRIAERTKSRFNITITKEGDVAKEIAASTTYMIEVDDRIVGFISYGWESFDHVYVSEVQVDPDFQGRGIGSFALSFIIQEVKEKGAKIADLHTHPESRAQHLYRRCGFEPTGEIIENYCGTEEPRMRMLLKLV